MPNYSFKCVKARLHALTQNRLPEQPFREVSRPKAARCLPLAEVRGTASLVNAAAGYFQIQHRVYLSRPWSTGPRHRRHRHHQHQH